MMRQPFNYTQIVSKTVFMIKAGFTRLFYLFYNTISYSLLYYYNSIIALLDAIIFSLNYFRNIIVNTPIIIEALNKYKIFPFLKSLLPQNTKSNIILTIATALIVFYSFTISFSYDTIECLKFRLWNITLGGLKKLIESPLKIHQIALQLMGNNIAAELKINYLCEKGWCNVFIVLAILAIIA